MKARMKAQGGAHQASIFASIFCFLFPLAGFATPPTPGNLLQATFESTVDPKPQLGKYSKVELRIKTVEDTHLRLIAYCDGNEIVGGTLHHDVSLPWNYITRKVLFQDEAFQKGVVRTFHFQLHCVKPNGFTLYFEPWERKEGITWREMMKVGYKGWFYYEGAGGEFTTPEEAQARRLSNGIKDTLEWELGLYLDGMVNRNLVFFHQDEPRISRPEAICLLDKAYYMVEGSKNSKDGLYYNPNKYEEPEIPLRRAIKAIQADAAKQANDKEENKLETYREIANQWKSERTRLKIEEEKINRKRDPPEPLKNTVFFWTEILVGILILFVSGFFVSFRRAPFKRRNSPPGSGPGSQ
jgi:hypothetical protein